MNSFLKLLTLPICGALLLISSLACSRAKPGYPIQIKAGGPHDLTLSGEARFDRKYKALIFNEKAGVMAATDYLECRFSRPILENFFYGQGILPDTLTAQMDLRFTSRSVQGVHLHLQVFDREGRLLGEAVRDEQVGPEKVTEWRHTLPGTTLWNDPRFITMGLSKVENAARYTLTLDRLK